MMEGTPETEVLGDGRTYLTVAGLIAFNPKHPLLDRLVTSADPVRRPMREFPDALVLCLSR